MDPPRDAPLGSSGLCHPSPLLKCERVTRGGSTVRLQVMHETMRIPSFGFIQRDLHNLEKQGHGNLMRFNRTKCWCCN